MTRTIKIVRDVLKANEQIAQEVADSLSQRGVYAMNLMSSPGAGKTSLLERLIGALPEGVRPAVIEGDIQTQRDADRIAVLEVPVVQINTDGACHLDANMVRTALGELDMKGANLLMIENIGNLVCPASYWLGEATRVTVLSVAEGDDKPAKYPAMFERSQGLVINKIDLLPYCTFSMERVMREAREINPSLEIFPLSCRTGEGMEAFVSWVVRGVTGEGA